MDRAIECANCGDQLLLPTGEHISYALRDADGFAPERFVMIATRGGEARLFHMCAWDRPDARDRIGQAPQRVARQAQCSIDAALRLMVDAAIGSGVLLDTVADAALEGSVTFPNL